MGTIGQFQFTVVGLTPGKTNVLQWSSDLSNWTAITTNVAVGNSFQIADAAVTNLDRRFYRIFEMR
jgi:hypothetical protein